MSKKILDKFQRRVNGDYEYSISASFVLSKAYEKADEEQLKVEIDYQLRELKDRLNDLVDDAAVQLEVD